MNNKNKIIALIVGVVIFVVVIILFIKLLPFIILAVGAFWIYKKIRFRNPNKDFKEINNIKEDEKFGFIDAEYKDVDYKDVDEK